MSHEIGGPVNDASHELVEIPSRHRNVHSSSGGESGLDWYSQDSLDPMPAVGYSPLSVLGTGEGSLDRRLNDLCISGGPEGYIKLFCISCGKYL